MAKISARGAKEIYRVHATSEASSLKYLFVLTSDGRILKRVTGDAGTGYTLEHKVKHSENITAEYLRRYVSLRGLTVE